jgi:Ni/Co efflux regulator RcnB
MRKILISILLAGAAASPALAQDNGRWHHDQRESDQGEAREQRQQAHQERQQAHEQRQQAREQVRPERFNGGGDAERAQQAQQQQARHFELRQQAQQGQRGGWDRSRFEGRGTVAPQQVVEQQQQQQRRYRDYRGGFDGRAQQVEQARRSGGWSRDRGSWSQNRDGDFRQRQVQQQSYRDRSRWASGGWNRDWRNDRRYDWRNYRDRHRSTFRLGIYFDPFGYGYRSFDIGYRLQPRYYGQQYWFDPAMYGLPYPPPGTQWVRYWNDALLIDTYTGEVVDVIHNFFW